MVFNLQNNTEYQGLPVISSGQIIVSKQVTFQDLSGKFLHLYSIQIIANGWNSHGDTQYQGMKVKCGLFEQQVI